MRLYQQQRELSRVRAVQCNPILDVGVQPADRIRSHEETEGGARIEELCDCFSLLFDSDKSLQRKSDQNSAQSVGRILLKYLYSWFDRFILLTILANCVFLAMDDPNLPPFDYQIYADLVFQIIFTIEMVLKIIALGFLFKPHSYMRDAWNIVSTKTQS